jgi:methionyl-tRNA synthetase
MGNFFAQSAWYTWLILAWTLPWKGVALWRAAKSSDKVWFIVLLLVNTLGLLEILYIFVFSLRTKKQEPAQVEEILENKKQE